MTTRWDELADLAHEALEEGDSTAYLAQLPGFVAEADRLVHVLEVGNAAQSLGSDDGCWMLIEGKIG